MKIMFNKIAGFFIRGLSSIVFPNVCVACGMEVTEQQKQICSFCLNERFEDANPDNRMHSAAEILPEGVRAQHALWQFDKGGILQDLMHKLKYDRLTLIGIQLGEQVGHRTQKHPQLFSLMEAYADEVILIPVPLHYLKFIRRGFNQAFLIARGIQNSLHIPICDPKDVVRNKNTRSQTGFDLKQRNENIQDAFTVKNEEKFRGKLAIIVDDVFTTGATSFELSKQLLLSGAEEVVILTVAQA